MDQPEQNYFSCIWCWVSNFRRKEPRLIAIFWQTAWNTGGRQLFFSKSYKNIKLKWNDEREIKLYGWKKSGLGCEEGYLNEIPEAGGSENPDSFNRNYNPFVNRIICTANITAMITGHTIIGLQLQITNNGWPKLYLQCWKPNNKSHILYLQQFQKW